MYRVCTWAFKMAGITFMHENYTPYYYYQLRIFWFDMINKAERKKERQGQIILYSNAQDWSDKDK